jgi:hypothetical protein
MTLDALRWYEAERMEAEATGNRKRARIAERKIRQLEKKLSGGDGLKASIEEFLQVKD